MSSSLREAVERLVQEVNADAEAKERAKRWIGRYFGKSIGFACTDTQQKFYLVFTPEKAKLVEGEPATFEVLLFGEEQRLASALQGDNTDLWREARSGGVTFWGNLHEVGPFSQLAVGILRKGAG